jgi:hypothetical protein
MLFATIAETASVMVTMAILPEDTLQRLISKAMNSICTNCVHASYCKYRKRTKKTIVQCELYDAGPVVTSVASANPVSLQSPASAKGLCVNCSRASHCVLQKEPSGVWHCDEYE